MQSFAHPILRLPLLPSGMVREYQFHMDKCCEDGRSLCECRFCRGVRARVKRQKEYAREEQE